MKINEFTIDALTGVGTPVSREEISGEFNVFVRYEKLEQIAQLKAHLKSTDYQAIKFAEGELSAEEYADIKEQRRQWRTEIEQLELELKELNKDNI